MSILQSKIRLLLALIAGVLTVATPSLATPVSGTFSIGGSSAEVSAMFLNFVCNPALTASCPSASGNFLITTPVSGTFAPLLGTDGFIKNLSQATAPINAPISVPNFITFQAAPATALDLTFIFPGVAGQAQCAAAPAPGQNCTPILPALISPTNPLGLSAFTLTNLQVGSIASFSVSGTALGTAGELSTFTGVFTAQFNVFYQEVLATIAPGGTIENSYSATFIVTPVSVPESTSLTMLIGGLLLVGGMVRRRF